MTWDELKVYLKGKVFLIGLTFVDKDGHIVEEYQTSGTVTELSDEAVIVFLRPDKSIFQISYESEHIVRAAPGKYKETETGTIIIDPDFTASFRIATDNISQIKKIKENGYTT
jgi:hypothetical protein